MIKQANDASYLFDKEVEVIDTVVSRAPDLDLTFSRVFAFKQMSNPEAEVSKYRVADTDGGAAELLRKLAEYPKIKISGTESTTEVWKVGISFDIPVEDVKNSRAWGRPLDTEYVERAKRAVDDKMNALAYVGDSQFGVPGILELTGVTAHSGSDFDLASLNLADEITRAVNAIPVQFRKRQYSLVLADNEWKKLVKIGNTTSNQTWLEIATRQHPNVQFVVESKLDSATALASGATVAVGTAMLIPSDPILCRLQVGFMPMAVFQPNQNVEFEEKISGKVKARLSTVEVPHPTSIVKITGWDA